MNQKMDLIVMNQKVNKHNKQNFDLPNDLTDDQYERELRKIARQMLKTSYNILEDERIESNTMKN